MMTAKNVKVFGALQQKHERPLIVLTLSCIDVCMFLLLNTFLPLSNGLDY